MAENESPIVFIVDDDAGVNIALSRLLRTAGFRVEPYTTAQDFLDHYRHEDVPGCIVLDVALGDWNGLDVQRRLNVQDCVHPVIFISGQSELYTSVQAMKAGAVDFLVKPINADTLFEAIYAAIEKDRLARLSFSERVIAKRRLARLTPREYEVLALVVRGKLNKQIAFELGIVEKTAKVHRGRVMAKMRARHVTELIRMVEHSGLMPSVNTTNKDRD
jgi:FixJ family two-component response regulator